MNYSEIEKSLEVHRTIPGYKNYTITSWGRVYSINTGEFLTQEITGKGYMRVVLRDESGKRKHLKVHRLVAEAFVPNVYEKTQVNHIDGNSRNNSYTNLEWVTDEENKLKQQQLKLLQYRRLENLE